MQIDGVSSIDVNTSPQAYGKQTLSQDDFMRLLLEELSHQDPLNPMDSKEFTVQMTQFSTLEGINQMTESMGGIDDINLNLQNLLAYQQSMQNATVTNMIGKTVKMDGSFSHLGETAAMNYDLPEDAATVRIIIRNAAGEPVYAEDLGPQASGSNKYIWGGTDPAGERLSEGTYTFDIEARDESGQLVPADTHSSGHVTGVTYEDGLAYLVLDNSTRVDVSDVKTIEE